MNKITINLWFTDEAEEAAKFYTDIFPNSSITEIAHYPDAGQEVTGQAAGNVMTASFNLDGQQFLALNGGDMGYKFTEATSFIINCENQEEVDHYWHRLAADGGSEVQCGWLKDRYGVSWQVIPVQMNEFFASGDPEKSARVMDAMLKMKKIVIADLEAAANG
jgi:predicted 3-demethylubiquinone-9 3-methyltransferase (glyoxalase superfamily)